MKANAKNLTKSLNNLVNLFNKNMGYSYRVEHYEEDSEVAVFCNPTNAMINDVTMIARAYLNNANDAVYIGECYITILYYRTSFKDNVDTMLLEIVGAL